MIGLFVKKHPHIILKSHPDDLDSIVCHIRMNTTSGEHLHKYVIESMQKFPTDPFLMEMNVICSVNRIECQYFVADALKAHPNNIRLLYARATALSMAEVPRTDPAIEIQAWNDFLKYAPKDHPKVPAAHYRFEKKLRASA